MSVITIETKIELVFHLEWSERVPLDSPFYDLILAVFNEFYLDAILWPGI